MKHGKVLSILSVVPMVIFLLTACTSPRLTVKLTETGCTYEGPSSIPYGKFIVNWRVNDQKHNKTVVLVITLAEGKTIDDLKAASYYGEAPEWVNILWNDDENAFGADLNKIRGYHHEHDLNTLDSYQGQPLYLICGNEEGVTNPLGPIEVTKK